MRDVAIFCNIPYNISRPFFGRLFFVRRFFENWGMGRKMTKNGENYQM